MKVLFTLLICSHIAKIKNSEYASIKQRRADLVVWLANQELLHPELQSNSDTNMLWREWEYYGLIASNSHCEKISHFRENDKKFLSQWQCASALPPLT